MNQRIINNKEINEMRSEEEGRDRENVYASVLNYQLNKPNINKRKPPQDDGSKEGFLESSLYLCREAFVEVTSP